MDIHNVVMVKNRKLLKKILVMEVFLSVSNQVWTLMYPEGTVVCDGNN